MLRPSTLSKRESDWRSLRLRAASDLARIARPLSELLYEVLALKVCIA